MSAVIRNTVTISLLLTSNNLSSHLTFRFTFWCICQSWRHQMHARSCKSSRSYARLDISISWHADDTPKNIIWAMQLSWCYVALYIRACDRWTDGRRRTDGRPMDTLVLWLKESSYHAVFTVDSPIVLVFCEVTFIWKFRHKSLEQSNQIMLYATVLLSLKLSYC